MNIFICDDEIEITNYLEKLLITFFRNSKIALPNITIYNDGNSLLSDPNVKDIVFLDVEMDGISGIYVGQELKKQNKNCIIITLVYIKRDVMDGGFKIVYDKVMLIMDTIGLAIFTVVGVNIGIQQGYIEKLFLLTFLGTITGVGGGLMRDVMAGEKPYIFVKHVYASASVVGAMVCVYNRAL